MIVSCTSCQVKLKVDETKIKEGGSRLKCPKCQGVFTVYRPDETPAAAAPPAPPPPPPPPAQTRPAPPSPPPPSAPAPQAPKWQLDRRKVLVAHNGESVLKLVEGLLSGSGFQPICVSDGVQAMVELERQKPAVAVLDVGLPSIYGFEICDRLKHRHESSDVKVILIASIYDKTRYKREPTSLYGADDYIEKHHIEDFLAKKVDRLLSPAPQPPVREERSFAAPPVVEHPRRDAQAEQMRRDEMKPIAAPSPADQQQVEAARRFARIVISDIALYNQGAVEEGIRGGNLAELLSEEFKEGRDLYNSRVPAEVRGRMDYFADELDKFVEKKKAILDMGTKG